MFPGMSEAEVRVAEFRFRQMRDEARTRQLLGHDATGQAGPVHRLCTGAKGVVTQVVGRRAATEVPQSAPALRERAAS